MSFYLSKECTLHFDFVIHLYPNLINFWQPKIKNKQIFPRTHWLQWLHLEGRWKYLNFTVEEACRKKLLYSSTKNLTFFFVLYFKIKILNSTSNDFLELFMTSKNQWRRVSHKKESIAIKAVSSGKGKKKNWWKSYVCIDFSRFTYAEIIENAGETTKNKKPKTNTLQFSSNLHFYFGRFVYLLLRLLFSVCQKKIKFSFSIRGEFKSRHFLYFTQAKIAVAAYIREYAKNNARKRTLFLHLWVYSSNIFVCTTYTQKRPKKQRNFDIYLRCLTQFATKTRVAAKGKLSYVKKIWVYPTFEVENWGNVRKIKRYRTWNSTKKILFFEVKNK